MTALAKADFQLLGVAPSSSFAEVRSAWRGLVRSTHPDISADATAGDRMALLNAAYDRIVAAIGASTEHRATDADPATAWADHCGEHYTRHRAGRRGAVDAEVRARSVRRREVGRYARDPETIRPRYARVFA